MHRNKVLASLIITFMVLSCLGSPANGLRVIFLGKPSVEKGQILISSARKAPCPNGLIRDHVNRCRKAFNFYRCKLKKMV